MQFATKIQNYSLSIIMLEENEVESIDEVKFVGVVLDTS